MHFIKLSRSYINLDNVTAIVPEAEGCGYVVGFVGQKEYCAISAADMVYIRRQLEKIKTLQDYDKIVIQNPPEADKVIAELKECVKDLILDNYLKDKELRHQKRKRCLAMAKWCADVRELMHKLHATDVESDRRRMKACKWCRKWRNHWLELAEKFKPNSTAQ